MNKEQTLRLIEFAKEHGLMKSPVKDVIRLYLSSENVQVS